MQKLQVFQSLWATESRHPSRAEGPHEETFDMIATAGYLGVCLDPSLATLDKYQHDQIERWRGDGRPAAECGFSLNSC